MHFWPHVDKAKIGLKNGSFLWQKMNFQKLEKMKSFSKSIEIFWTLGGIRTRDLQIISLASNHYTTKHDVRSSHFRSIDSAWAKNQLLLRKNCHLSNQFWLYQLGARSGYFQRYEPWKREILIWVTLYFLAIVGSKPSIFAK